MKDSEAQHLLQRLESAEEALKFYAEELGFDGNLFHDEWGNKARAHFEKYGEKAR